MPRPKRFSRAFTRVELLILVATITLLALIAAPVLATSKSDSERAICFNNLRRIGQAVRQWGGDHYEEPPWLTPISDGGTRPDRPGSVVKPALAWGEYLSLSNELATPRVLACPADASARVASDWSAGPGGLLNVNFRNQAISYLVGLHADSIHPRALLAADFNMRLSGNGGCVPAMVNSCYTISAPYISSPPEAVQWTNGPHGSVAGHLLVVDGSVAFLNSEGLTRTVSTINSTENGNHHILRAH
jgi:competence protein ComGC